MEVKGQVESIVFHNEDNGYTVCNLDVDNELVTAVGTLPFINVGDIIKAEGNMINHAILEEVSKILMREVKNQDLKFVTITDAETTSDLSY